MEISQILFQKLSKQLTQDLKDIEVQAECMGSINPNYDPKLQNMQYHTFHSVLQLKQSYVLRCHPQTKVVQEGFKCESKFFFKILRNVSPQRDKLMGKPIGISFGYSNTENFLAQFYVHQSEKDLNNLQQFTVILGKKNIFQQGFQNLFQVTRRFTQYHNPSVFSANRITDGREVKIKAIKKEIYFNFSKKQLKILFDNQFRVLSKLNCAYICELISVYQSNNSLYMINDLTYKSLYDYRSQYEYLNSLNRKKILQKLLKALNYLHKKKIIHRDIKLENIMIKFNFQKDIIPTIINFNIAQQQQSAQYLFVQCGTPGYIAPEIINYQQNNPLYTTACDMYSMGIIFYILIAGKFPFQAQNAQQIFKLNKQGFIDLELKDNNLSEASSRDLLMKMLEKNSQTRITPQEALNHIYFKEIKEQQKLCN